MILPMNHEQASALAPISLEQSYILYGNMTLRAERSLFAADVEEGELLAVGSYLQGMPFHAFSMQLFSAEEDYDVTEMLNYSQAIRVYEKLGYETVSRYAFVEFAL